MVNEVLVMASQLYDHFERREECKELLASLHRHPLI